MAFYYVVIDFECTCWPRKEEEDWTSNPAHEIIEFPAIFLNSETLKVDFEFHAFVRPTENPILSPFCFELTGIEQAEVDAADDLETVLVRFTDFLSLHRIEKFLPVTDGPWDFEKFLFPETKRKEIDYPVWGRKWLDIRRRFQHHFRLEKWIGVNEMLEKIGLEFEGRQHSGIDDAKNIARIVAHVQAQHKQKGKMKHNRNIDDKTLA